jgi:hypothetical protein
MKINVINEIIDDEGGLIGSDNMPKTGSNLMSVSKRTSDYNMSMGHQKMGDHVLGYFGAVMMPFFEGEESNESSTKKFASAAFTLYLDILAYYYKNPNKLKNDYRVYVDKKAVPSEICKFVKMLLTDIKDKDMPVDESVVVEDKVLDSKNTEEFSKKSDAGDVNPKGIEKVADLINKLDNDAKLKLKKLIETN